MNSDNHNLASKTRWICDIPLRTLSNDFENLTLNITKFTVPEVDISTVKTAYLGYSVEMPTGIAKADEKRLVINYLLSSNYSQYAMLYRWLQRQGVLEIQAETTPGEKANTDLPPLRDFRLPVNVYLLSEFKKPVLKIRYDACFIVNFGELSLDYSSNDEVIEHSFTLAYTNFNLSLPT